MSATPLLDLDTARGGIDSLAWMLNNVQNAGSAQWDNLLASAMDDAQKGRDALERLRRFVADMEEK